MLVAIDPGVEIPFLNRSDETRRAVRCRWLRRIREGALVTFMGSDIIAGGEGVFGVETDAQPVALFRRVDDVADLLEAVTEIRALAGGDFQGDFDVVAGAGFVDFVQRPGDGLDAFDLRRHRHGRRGER